MALPRATDVCLRSLRRADSAFTLVELLVATSVLALLVVLTAQLFSGAVSVVTMGNKRMDADEQSRLLFDRMATDIARMVKRSDVDYLLKQPANPQTGGPGVGSNDQIAFYSEVPGYYPATGAQSPVSLVAYRVNAKTTSGNYQKVERLGKGLVWNGVSTTATDSPVLFLPVPLASPLPSPLPSPMPSAVPTPAWPQAGSSTLDDPDGQYELMGPQVFRMEYYYLLKGQSVSGTNYPSILTATPWDTRIGHQSVSGLSDVAAIVVTIAILDPASQALVTPAQLYTLGARLADFTEGSSAGTMEAQWQTAIDTATPGFPPAAQKWVRVYHRYFYLNLPQ